MDGVSPDTAALLGHIVVVAKTVLAGRPFHQPNAPRLAFAYLGLQRCRLRPFAYAGVALALLGVGTLPPTHGLFLQSELSDGVEGLTVGR